MDNTARKGANLIKMLRRAWPAMLLSLCLAVILARAMLPPRHVTMDVLDVGQGDAILIQDGYAQMLVDGGPDGAVLGELGEVMPFFDRTIEVVVLTHPHTDHYVGLISVLQRYRVLRVVRANRAGAGSEYGEFEKALVTEGAEVMDVGAGDEVGISDRARATIIWPPLGGTARNTALQNDDPNASSVALRLTAPGGTALLTGDMTAEVEEALLTSGANLQADILKVAHHGSRYSSTQKFLEAVQPRFAAVSVGLKNNYGHPGWSVLRRLESIGARVYRTDQEGRIRMEFLTSGIRVRTTVK